MHSKNVIPILGSLYTCFVTGNKTGIERILVIFQDRPMFSRMNGKILPRSFE